MRTRSFWLLAITFLLAGLASGQPSRAGAAFPLTNTRYGVDNGAFRLLSDGRDFYLFWQTGWNVRMTKLVDGESRAGRPVMSTVGGEHGTTSSFDVVWNGRYFLVTAVLGQRTYGQLVAADGERVGNRFGMESYESDPRLAFNGTNVLLIVTKDQSRGRVLASLRTTEGRIVGLIQEVLAGVVDDGAPVHSPKYAVASNGSGYALLIARRDGDRFVVFDSKGVIRSTQRIGGPSASVALASDGRGYRAAGTTADSHAWSFGFDASGAMETASTFEDARTVSSLVWTGTGYTASLIDTTGAVRVLELDAKGDPTATSAATSIDLGSPGHVELASNGRRVRAAWRSSLTDGVQTSDAPLTSSSGTQTAFAAASQYVAATATSGQSALIVWAEQIGSDLKLRAGARAVDGTWTEHRIADASSQAYAASDGNEFVVLFDSGERWYLRRLDAKARPLGPAVAVTTTVRPSGLIWNGRSYSVIGSAFTNGASHVDVALLTPNGVMSPAMEIYRGTTGEYLPIDDLTLVWNGQMYLATWRRELPYTGSNYFGTFYAIEGVRLGADLQRLDGVVIGIVTDEGVRSTAAWDGSNFVVAMSSYQVQLKRVSPAGDVGTALTIGASGLASVTHLTPIMGGVAVSWHDYQYLYSVATFGPNATTHFDYYSPQRTFTSSYFGGRPAAVALPDGRVAVVAAVAADAPPYHGALRLMMSVLDYGRPSPLTVAPAVSVRSDGSRLVIDWTAIASPVTGYRVEYRIGDGNWNEIERSPDPIVRTATFRLPRTYETYSFRVRAMSDEGMGPYSTPASIYLGKKRSVR